MSDVPFGRVAIDATTYLGEHPARSRKVGRGVLVFDATGIHMRGLRELFMFPWTDVIGLNVEAGRPGDRKKDSYLIVSTTAGDANFNCTRTPPMVLRAKLRDVLAWFETRTGRQAADRLVEERADDAAAAERFWAVGYLCPPDPPNEPGNPEVVPLCLACAAQRYGRADDGLVDVPPRAFEQAHEASPVSLWSLGSSMPGMTAEDWRNEFARSLREMSCSRCALRLIEQACPLMTQCGLAAEGFHLVADHLPV